MSKFNSRCATFISVCNQPSRSAQPGHPFVGRCIQYSQRAVTLCGWEVKAGMICVWVAGKTVWSPRYTQTISERFRDEGLTIKCYINSSVYFLHFIKLLSKKIAAIMTEEYHNKHRHSSQKWKKNTRTTCWKELAYYWDDTEIVETADNWTLWRLCVTQSANTQNIA